MLKQNRCYTHLDIVLSEDRGSLSVCDPAFMCHVLSGLASVQDQLLALYFWRSFYVSGTLLGAGNSMMNSTGMGATLSIFLPGMFLHNGFQREAPGLAVSASPRNLLEMQIGGQHPRPVNSGAMGVGPHMGCFHEPSRRCWCTLKFGNHCSYIKKRMLSPLYSPSEVEVGRGCPSKSCPCPKVFQR